MTTRSAPWPWWSNQMRPPRRPWSRTKPEARSRGLPSSELGRQLDLELVADPQPVLSPFGNRGLEPPGLVDGAMMHRRQSHPAVLVEGDRVQVVIGGDQPEPATPLASGALGHRLHERRADALPPIERVQGQNFAGLPVKTVRDEADQSPVPPRHDRRRR